MLYALFRPSRCMSPAFQNNCAAAIRNHPNNQAGRRPGMVYGEPGASVMLVGVTVKTNNAPSARAATDDCYCPSQTKKSVIIQKPFAIRSNWTTSVEVEDVEPHPPTARSLPPVGDMLIAAVSEEINGMFSKVLVVVRLPCESAV